jgi:hypothetical protein
MRRNAGREGYDHFLAALRGPPTPPSTLGSLQATTPGKWLWLHCASSAHCNHHAPVAIAPFVIRWGPNEPSDTLRRCARCSKCGHKGAATVGPSYIDADAGFAPFPVGQMSAAWHCR